MKLKTILTSVFALVGFVVFGQQAGEIASVQLYPKGNEIGLPLLNINGGGQLVLEFDVFGDDAPYYNYRIEHYSANWEKTNINPIQYIKGFNEGNIDDYEYSFETNMNYTHYEFEFPNAATKFKVSGNYKISVFEDGVKEPVLSKKFMVTEQQVAITGTVENAKGLGKLNSHQQIDFAVNTEGFVANNPRQDFQANIIQNMRPDNMLVDIKPQRDNGKLLLFTNPFGQTFGAGNEYRWFNMRSTRYKTENIAEHLVRDDETIDTYLIPGRPRTKQDYRPYNDFNGGFYIDHQEGNRPDLDSDYVNVHFTLQETPALKDKDVYVYGAFNDWKLDERAKMKFNPKHNLLEAVMLLKQGNYDYLFATIDKDGIVSTDDTEGNFFRTRNEYTIFVYYKPFGARYDRLVGVQQIDSRFN